MQALMNVIENVFIFIKDLLSSQKAISLIKWKEKKKRKRKRKRGGWGWGQEMPKRNVYLQS